MATRSRSRSPRKPSALSDGEYTVQQKCNMRFLDAYESGHDYQVVTREAEGNDSQKWVIKAIGGGDFTIQQKVNMRFLDGYGGGERNCVTRTAQGDNTQKWVIKGIGGEDYTIQWKHDMTFLDAHEQGAVRSWRGTVNYDYRVVTRPAQNDNSQKWVIKKTAQHLLPAAAPKQEWETHVDKDIFYGQYDQGTMNTNDIEKLKEECIKRNCGVFVTARSWRGPMAWFKSATADQARAAVLKPSKGHTTYILAKPE